MPLVDVIRVYLLAFGVVTIAGGAVGFAKAKSRASLIAGAVSGLLLLLAAWFTTTGARPALLLGLSVSAALASRFGMVLLKSKRFIPAGLITVLALGGIALTVAGLFAT